MRSTRDARHHRAHRLPAAAILAALTAAGCAGGSGRPKAQQPLCGFLESCAFGREVPIFKDMYLHDLHADGAGHVRALLGSRGAPVPSQVATLREDGSFTAQDVPVHYGLFPRGARDTTRVLGPPRGLAPVWQIYAPDGAGGWTGTPMSPEIGFPMGAVEDAEGRVLTLLGWGTPPPESPSMRPLLLATRDPGGAWSSRSLSQRVPYGHPVLEPAGPRGFAAAFWEDRAPTAEAAPEQVAAGERVLVYVGPDGARRDVHVTGESYIPAHDRVRLIAPARDGDDAVVAFSVSGAVYVARVHARGGVEVSRAFTPVAVGVDLCSSRPEAPDRTTCEAQPPCRLDTREVRRDFALARTGDGAAWLLQIVLVTGADMRFRWVEQPRHPWDPAGRGETPPRFTFCSAAGEQEMRAELEVLRVGATLDQRVRREVESKSAMSPSATGLYITAHGPWVYWGYTGALGARVAGLDTSQL